MFSETSKIKIAAVSVVFAKSILFVLAVIGVYLGTTYYPLAALMVVGVGAAIVLFLPLVRSMYRNEVRKREYKEY